MSPVPPHDDTHYGGELYELCSMSVDLLISARSSFRYLRFVTIRDRSLITTLGGGGRQIRHVNASNSSAVLPYTHRPKIIIPPYMNTQEKNQFPRPHQHAKKKKNFGPHHAHPNTTKIWVPPLICVPPRP